MLEGLPRGLGGLGGSVWVPPSRLAVPVPEETKFLSRLPPKRLFVNFFLFIKVLLVWLKAV